MPVSDWAIYLSIYLPIYLTIYIYNYLSISLSIFIIYLSNHCLGNVPAGAGCHHRGRLHDQDRRDRGREDQASDLGHRGPGEVR